MKKVLFYTFIIIFIITALITLAGIIDLITIRKEYLNKLFYALIIELVGAVVAMFRSTNFFSGDSKKMNILILPRDEFSPRYDPHTINVTVFDADTDKGNPADATLLRENGYLSAYMDNIKHTSLIKVDITNARNDKWSSDFFNPNTAKAEMKAL